MSTPNPVKRNLRRVNGGQHIHPAIVEFEGTEYILHGNGKVFRKDVRHRTVRVSDRRVIDGVHALYLEHAGPRT
jgi:hypothetical protein